MGGILVELLSREKTCASLSRCTHWWYSGRNPFKKRLSDSAVRVSLPQEVNVQKINFTLEIAGLVSQNRLIKEFYFYGIDDSNEEEHQKTDYAVVNYSDASVDDNPHK